MNKPSPQGHKTLILQWLTLQVVVPAGLEPATSRLEGGCSIQLSYGTFEANVTIYNPSLRIFRLNRRFQQLSKHGFD